MKFELARGRVGSFVTFVFVSCTNRLPVEDDMHYLGSDAIQLLPPADQFSIDLDARVSDMSDSSGDIEELANDARNDYLPDGADSDLDTRRDDARDMKSDLQGLVADMQTDLHGLVADMRTDLSLPPDRCACEVPGPLVVETCPGSGLDAGCVCTDNLEIRCSTFFDVACGDAPECFDGSTISCCGTPPSCPGDTHRAIVDGCWVCISDCG